MYFQWCKTAQVFVVILVPNMKLVVYQSGIFFLEHLLEYTFHFISVLIITLVLCHLVDEEKRQALDTPLEQLAFFLEMRLDGFPYLHTLHRQFIGIANHFATAQGYAIKEGYITTDMNF